MRLKGCRFVSHGDHRDHHNPINRDLAADLLTASEQAAPAPDCIRSCTETVPKGRLGNIYDIDTCHLYQETTPIGRSVVRGRRSSIVLFTEIEHVACGLDGRRATGATTNTNHRQHECPGELDAASARGGHGVHYSRRARIPQARAPQSMTSLP